MQVQRIIIAVTCKKGTKIQFNQLFKCYIEKYNNSSSIKFCEAVLKVQPCLMIIVSDINNINSTCLNLPHPHPPSPTTPLNLC